MLNPEFEGNAEEISFFSFGKKSLALKVPVGIYE